VRYSPQITTRPWSETQAWHEAGKRYAVLMLFLQNDGKHDEVVLIKRTDKVPTHPGQIAFAGGAAESTDADPIATALRETEEELGIPQNEVKIIGMTPHVPSLDGGIIVPVAATTMFPREKFVADQFEVAEVICAPWLELRQEVASSFQFDRFGKTVTSRLFTLGEHRVWGLTAEMIFRANFR